jgi:dTDP-4-amino-4,6-dideoxygalactose transaminase
VNAVEMCGGKPVFVDICDDLHIDLKKCEKLVNRKTEGPLWFTVHI